MTTAKKSEKITIRTTKKLKAELKKQARELGVSLSSYITMRLKCPTFAIGYNDSISIPKENLQPRPIELERLRPPPSPSPTPLAKAKQFIKLNKNIKEYKLNKKLCLIELKRNEMFIKRKELCEMS